MKIKWTTSGFTLIELLIVVAIIAILAAIAIPNFIEAQVRSKVSRCKADMRSIGLAIEAYRVDNPVYPPDQCTLGGESLQGPDLQPRPYLKVLTTPIAYMTSLP